MPNWCTNEVNFSFSDPAVLESFKDNFMSQNEDGDYYLDFYKIAPLGLGTKENGSPVWDYDTACRTWGVKWELSSHDYLSIDVSDNRDDPKYPYFDANIHGTFSTAWSPPVQIFNILADWMLAQEQSTPFWFYREDGVQMCGYLSD